MKYFHVFVLFSVLSGILVLLLSIVYKSKYHDDHELSKVSIKELIVNNNYSCINIDFVIRSEATIDVWCNDMKDKYIIKIETAKYVIAKKK